MDLVLSSQVTQSLLPRVLSTLLFALFFFSGRSTSAQEARPWGGALVPPPQTEQSEEDYYANAHPYLDEPLKSLSKEIPELRKVQPAADQQPLAGILEKTAANVDGFFHDIVDLIAEEKITQERSTGLGNTKVRVQDSYLIVHDDNQSDVLEYRMDAEGKRLDQRGMNRGYLVTVGFALICNYFSTVSQPESRFRYLGTEKVGPREAYVVAFAQKPGHATQFVTMVGRKGTTVNMLVQGIAWVDKDNFQIVRMRTDLLAPHLEIDLDRQTTEVTFSSVQLHDVATAFWLPSDVKVFLSFKEYDSAHRPLYTISFKNEHRYTDYRRYRVSVKMLPPN